MLRIKDMLGAESAAGDILQTMGVAFVLSLVAACDFGTGLQGRR